MPPHRHGSDLKNDMSDTGKNGTYWVTDKPLPFEILLKCDPRYHSDKSKNAI